MSDVDEDDPETNGKDKGNGKTKAKKKTKTKIVIPPLPKIPFTGKAPEEVADRDRMDRYLIKLAELLARLRAIVPTWHTRDTQGSDYGYGTAIIEEPNRAITQLRNLARGHALSQGRDYITVDDDIPLLIKVVMSTASIERSLIFDLLIANNGTLSTAQICQCLNSAKPTALRTMTELRAVGLVNMYCDVGYHNSETMIELETKFNWFMTDTFRRLKKNDCKEKYPPRKASHLPNLLYDCSMMNKIRSAAPTSSSCLCGGENSLQSNQTVEESSKTIFDDKPPPRPINNSPGQEIGKAETTYEDYMKAQEAKIVAAEAEATTMNKAHDIYKSGSKWRCNNCDEWGDKPHMTQERPSSHCSGVKRKR